MEKQTRHVKPYIYGFVLFAIVVITLAADTTARFGLAGNYVYMISVSAILSLLWLWKKPINVLTVLSGVIAINLPESTLISLGLDRDMLMGAVCAIILAPIVYALLDD